MIYLIGKLGIFLLLVAASNYFGAVFSRMGSASLIAE